MALKSQERPSCRHFVFVLKGVNLIRQAGWQAGWQELALDRVTPEKRERGCFNPSGSSTYFVESQAPAKLFPRPDRPRAVRRGAGRVLAAALCERVGGLYVYLACLGACQSVTVERLSERSDKASCETTLTNGVTSKPSNGLANCATGGPNQVRAGAPGDAQGADLPRRRGGRAHPVVPQPAQAQEGFHAQAPQRFRHQLAPR